MPTSAFSKKDPECFEYIEPHEESPCQGNRNSYTVPVLETRSVLNTYFLYIDFSVVLRGAHTERQASAAVAASA